MKCSVPFIFFNSCMFSFKKYSENPSPWIFRSESLINKHWKFQETVRAFGPFIDSSMTFLEQLGPLGAPCQKASLICYRAQVGRLCSSGYVAAGWGWGGIVTCFCIAKFFGRKMRPVWKSCYNPRRTRLDPCHKVKEKSLRLSWDFHMVLPPAPKEAWNTRPPASS